MRQVCKYVVFQLQFCKIFAMVIIKCLVLWASDPKVSRSGANPYHRDASLDKNLYSTLSLCTQVYKWVLASNSTAGGNPF